MKELKNNIVNEIMTKCESVICCRVSPKEKADVVRLVKNNLGKITLAIGDGANDVNMIQEAHIGIGLYGQEGMRAVQSSDYALPEFRALWKLLLVHGRWSYIRITEMILYFFYKNMIFTMPQVAFAFFNGYSGQTLYDDWYITFYNLAFTSIPLVIRALFDQDIYYKRWGYNEPGKENDLVTTTNYATKEYYAYLYYVGQKGLIFTITNLLFWIFQGIVYGGGMFVMILFCVDDQAINKDGEIIDIWYVSIVTYTAIILIVDLKLALHTKTWTWINWLSIVIFSIGIYLLFVWLGDMLPSMFKSFNTIHSIVTSPLAFLLLGFFSIFIVYVDYMQLIWEKEVSTPMRILFNSAKRRNQDADSRIFENLIKKNASSSDLKKPLVKS